MTRGWAAGLLAVALLAATPAAAEPVKVRLKEGNTRGFLALRPPGGDPIAYGGLGQRPSGTLVANRLLLNFKDGSVYNGMALTLLKNLPARATATAHMVAFTPKPRLIKMALAQEGTDSARVGGATRKANRYLVKLEVGGLTGVVASLAGKEPPDLRYWLIPGEVPAFGKFEGGMFLKGPTWRIEQIAIEWPP